MRDTDIYLGITFPFENSNERLLKLNRISNEEVKSKILFLLNTQKGTRIYQPEFGLDFRKYLFDMNDDELAVAIKEELNDSVKRWLTDVNIVSVETVKEKNALAISVNYTVSNGVNATPSNVSVAVDI